MAQKWFHFIANGIEKVFCLLSKKYMHIYQKQIV